MKEIPKIMSCSCAEVDFLNTNENSINRIFVDDFQNDNLYLSNPVCEDINARYENVVKNDVVAQFRDMQDKIMKEYTPKLTMLLSETPFESGYRSYAEIFFDELYAKVGIIADTILQNIYLQNMYGDKYIIKHLLSIVMNLPPEHRNIMQIIPIAGLSNPDIEIQDLSVKCFESWGDGRHLKLLKCLYEKTEIKWFKDYLEEVIVELENK